MKEEPLYYRFSEDEAFFAEAKIDHQHDPFAWCPMCLKATYKVTDPTEYHQQGQCFSCGFIGPVEYGLTHMDFI